MRYLWLTFLGLAVLIGLAGWWQQRTPASTPAAPAPMPASTVGLNAPAPGAAPAATAASEPAPAEAAASVAPTTGVPRRLSLSEALRPADPATAAAAPAAPPGPVADSLVRFALRQLGSPYTWAGTTPEGGFDCSGFLMYAYAHVGVPVPHSTALLISTGQPVARAEARPGDLVIFTGTAPASTTPGHAGIIISPNGELPLRFVHSSSARRQPGVKISQVEGSDYERRFMQVRRVLSGARPKGVSLAAASRPTPAARPRLAAVVAPLEKRPAAVKLADETEPPPPRNMGALVPRSAVKKAVGKARPVAAKKPVSPSKAKPVARRPPTKAKTRRSVKPVSKPRPKPRTVTAPIRKR